MDYRIISQVLEIKTTGASADISWDTEACKHIVYLLLSLEATETVVAVVTLQSNHVLW